MRFFALLLFVLLLTVSLVCAAPSHLKAYGAIYDWVKSAPAPSTELFTVSFALKQKNLDLVEKSLMEISDPANKRYGEEYTVAQIAEMTSIPESIAAVEKYLRSINAEAVKVYQSGDFIRAKIPIGTIEKEFNTKMFRFARSDNAKVITRCFQYTLPAELVPHVEFVTHLNHFPSKTPFSASSFTARSLASPQDAQNCVTPSLLNQFYNIPSNVVSNKGATQAVFEDNVQSFDYADLAQFNQMFNIPAQNVSKVIGINQPTTCAQNPNNCVESMLDVEWIMAVAQQAVTNFYGIDESDPQPFVDFLTELLNDPSAPFVNSVSYGEVETQVPPSITSQFNAVIQKIGLRRISVVIASGDDGAPGSGARGNVPAGCGFFPSYPASSPWVTAVGATQGPETATPGAEVGCSSYTGGLITSGGGFSTVWAQPSYQSAAVSAYLSSTNSSMPPKNLFNTAGRGYPDVAVMGHNYYDVVGGSAYQVSGTSASAPVFAGMLTLINSARLAAGKKTVGFANPALYSFAAQSNWNVYHDITNGLNNCPANQNPGSGDQCCQYGFPSVTGWDAMTGLGSVNFQNLLQAFMSM